MYRHTRLSLSIGHLQCLSKSMWLDAKGSSSSKSALYQEKRGTTKTPSQTAAGKTSMSSSSHSCRRQRSLAKESGASLSSSWWTQRSWLPGTKKRRRNLYRSCRKHVRVLTRLSATSPATMRMSSWNLELLILDTQTSAPVWSKWMSETAKTRVCFANRRPSFRTWRAGPCPRRTSRAAGARGRPCSRASPGARRARRGEARARPSGSRGRPLRGGPGPAARSRASSDP
mmetsp:Transcript_17639/g.55618  ORF Transcript_17639/g.55618 Transcript_17639/m.55618 type:complete len:229 (+) Transcript_17639:396-1082(+)